MALSQYDKYSDLSQYSQIQIKDHLSVSHGTNNFPYIYLQTLAGARAAITPYGAHLHSFEALSSDKKPVELLFSSKAIKHELGKAFRGGIPIIGPKFADGTIPLEAGLPPLGYQSLPSHGSLRTAIWQAHSAYVDSQTGQVSISFELVEPAGLEKTQIKLLYQVILADTALTTKLTVSNASSISDNAAYMQLALHSYFLVADSAQAAVRGLAGTKYLDRLYNSSNQLRDETRELIQISERTDRVYLNTPQVCSIQDNQRGHIIKIEKIGWPETVLWNPHTEQTQQIMGANGSQDLLADDYKRFICVEALCARRPLLVPSGQERTLSQIIRYCPI